MARTKQEIVAQMQQDFVDNTVLQQVYAISGANAFTDEFSLVSLEAAIIETISNESVIVEALQAAAENRIIAYVNAMEPGQIPWYQSQALNFQMGHQLVWNAQTRKYGYAVNDESARIVKLASVGEVGNGLVMKVAKLDTNDLPTPLTSLELDAFTAYMEMVKFAGVHIQKISRPADLIRLKLRVYYDPMILASDGSLLTNPSVFPVKSAVDDFLHLTPFNGMFNVTALINALEQVPGVVNPIFLNGSAKYGTQPFTNIVDYYQPNAGYMVHDFAQPLNVQYVIAP